MTTEMVSALAGRGHEVHFLTPKRQYPRWLYPGEDDRDPNACRRLKGALPELDPLSPLSWPGTRKRAHSLGGDAWIIPYWTWAWSGLWRFLLAGRRPPAIAVVHNPADHEATLVKRLAARSVLARFDALFTHGRALRAHLEATYPNLPVASYPFPPTDVGPMPSPDDARAALGVPEGRRVALFLGLIRPYKGVDLLMEAMARLAPEEDWLLIVAGEPWGKLGEEITDQVRRLGIGDRVGLRFGWVPEAEVTGLLAAADLVVLPYRSGSQSAVAPLALGAGVPVLCTAVGGLPEVVRDGIDGVVVRPGSVSELACVLTELDRRRLEELTRGAIEGRNRWTWDGYAERLEALARKVIEK
jgi:glycosyltransferase involved in cell wall biosynthesis